MCHVIEADDSSVVRELHVRCGEGFTGARVFVRPAANETLSPSEREGVVMISPAT
jgi:hypothetical protein